MYLTFLLNLPRYGFISPPLTRTFWRTKPLLDFPRAVQFVTEPTTLNLPSS